jgi:hypothetical protein
MISVVSVPLASMSSRSVPILAAQIPRDHCQI